jgi:cytochrome c5
MSPRRLVALLMVCGALTGAGLAAFAAAPRRGERPAAGGALAAVEQAPTEPPSGGTAPGAASGGRATPSVPAKNVYSSALPDSAGRAIVERWCTLCHSAMLITQQAKDSTAWEKTIGQMEKWGVAPTPEERDTLRAYLVKNFGPRVAPMPKAPATRDTARAPSQPR